MRPGFAGAGPAMCILAAMPATGTTLAPVLAAGQFQEFSGEEVFQLSVPSDLAATDQPETPQMHR